MAERPLNHDRDRLIQEHDLTALKERALAATSEGITISDRRLPDHPILYANAGFERLTGYPSAEVLGRNCRFLQGPGTDPEALARIRRAIREERPLTVELLNYRKDGTPFWNRLSITPVREASGEVNHFIGVQSDVTERRRAEEALAAANRRMKGDLEAAARIQRALLPAELPAVAGARLAWRFRPCEELAGDTLNIVRLDAENLGLYVLDVSGHGVPAALLSVTLSHWLSPVSGRSTLFAGDEEGPPGSAVASPAAVAEQLNRQFPLDLRAPQYFTLIYAVLEPRAGRLRYVAAGHPPPVLLARGRDPVVLPGRGFPVGVVPQPGYEEEALRLTSGDRVYFYTDGLTDAMDGAGRPYGEERLLEAVARARPLSLEESLAVVEREAEAWCREAGLDDDISLLAVELA